MQPIQISNHPQLSNVERYATRSKLEIDDERKIVILTLKVEHYIGSEKVIGLNDIYPRLIVDESTQVDAQGNIVEGVGVMSEWDFFELLGEMNVKINDIVRSKIVWADGLGRLNVY